jgi:ATP sulfurylase
MFYYHENGNIPLKTPRNEGLAIREGGRAMELLLFGKIIHNLNIKQALYILNENNYNKNVYQFKEDFEKLCQPSEKINDCRIAGEFSEYNLIDNNEVFGKENLTNVYIKLEDSDNFIIEYSEYDESLEGNVFH